MNICDSKKMLIDILVYLQFDRELKHVVLLSENLWIFGNNFMSSIVSQNCLVFGGLYSVCQLRRGAEYQLIAKSFIWNKFLWVFLKMLDASNRFRGEIWWKIEKSKITACHGKKHSKPSIESLSEFYELKSPIEIQENYKRGRKNYNRSPGDLRVTPGLI